MQFEIATRERAGADASVPGYKPLEARADADVLSKPGVVQVTLPGAGELELWEAPGPLDAGTGDFPPLLEDTQALQRVITWIRVRLPERSTGGGLSAKLSWVGVNATRVTQRARVPSEGLGTGTGEPDQSVTLVNRPVISGTVRLAVNGEPWKEVEDLLNAGPEAPGEDLRTLSDPRGQQRPEAKVFTVDRESGTVRFGNGARGARPPLGAAIRAGYDYGGGRQGNVNIGAVNKGAGLPSGFRVTNPLPTSGGDEPESVKEAKRNIPKYIRHKDRLVTQEDVKDIVRRTPGVEQVPMSGLELPRLLKVDARQGDPEGLDRLRGEAGPPEDGAERKKVVPVPVIPPEC